MCESILHRVVAVNDDHTVLAADVTGRVHRVSLLAYDGAPPARDSWMIVHSGYAITAVDDADAALALAELQRAGVVVPATLLGRPS
jgi:hydrogenase maturation factor